MTGADLGDEQRTARSLIDAYRESLAPDRRALFGRFRFVDGVRKVVEVGRALCAEPSLLLLDEPSSGLSVEETADMAFWIQDIRALLGITVLMVEHDMSLVSAVSDRVPFLCPAPDTA